MPDSARRLQLVSSSPPTGLGPVLDELHHVLDALRDLHGRLEADPDPGGPDEVALFRLTQRRASLGQLAGQELVRWLSLGGTVLLRPPPGQGRS